MLRDFVNTIFPNNCIACSEALYKQEEFICSHCLLALPETTYEATTSNPASKLLTGRTHFNTCIPLYYYQRGGKVQQILQTMKYKGQAELCKHMGKHIGIKLKKYNSLDDITAVIPVPLHPKKQKKRGYNQSYEMAAGISEIINQPVISEVLIRTNDSSTQTNKSRVERWQNVNEIFTLTNTETLKGKHVLLIDDVITTGATIEACCNVLNKVDNIKVSIATLATA